VCRLRLNKLGIFCLISAAALLFLLRTEMPLLGRGRGVSIKELLSVSIELCERAGQQILRHRAAAKINKSSAQISDSAPPVTKADLASNAELVFGFHKSFPWLHVVSEESQSAPVDYRALALASHRNPDLEPLRHDFFVNSNDVLVWVDPLDGTQEFTEHLLQYVSVQVCVAYRGTPLLGVLHFPFANKTYWAWRNSRVSDSLKEQLNLPIVLDKHVLKSDSHIKGAADKSHRRRRVLISRSHRGAQLNSTARKLFPNESVDLLSAAGAGYKLLLLSKGLADNYLHAGPIKKWDLCAGQAILEAMGGRLNSLRSMGTDSTSSGHLHRINYDNAEQYKHSDGFIAFAPSPSPTPKRPPTKDPRLSQ
ncbi:hypothetical protein BOX15_Mlig004071g8, partial [Macrostomum lignano]